MFWRYNAVNINDSQIGSYANLGFVHSGATIIETIAALGHHSVRDFLRLDHDNNGALETGSSEWALRFDGAAVEAGTLWAIESRLRRNWARALGTPMLFDPRADAVDIVGDVPRSDENARSVADLVHVLRDLRRP